MTEPDRHLAKARRCLASGRHLLLSDFTEQAGREAYLAAFHCALAFIGRKSGKEPRTHSGTRSEFARLVREHAPAYQHLVAFLARAYELKTYADYNGDLPISRQEAEAALSAASHMLEVIEADLT